MRNAEGPVDVLVGYAADRRGIGIAYARLGGTACDELLRVEFRAAAPAASRDRVIAYAALTAVSRVLLRRKLRNVRLLLADAPFVEEIATGRGVTENLAIWYVRLRCALNSLAASPVVAAVTEDLTQRARAEAALNVAA